MTTPQQARLADLAILVITALWGATFVVVKDALTDADPFTFLALRFSAGALVALALGWRALKSRELWRDGVGLGVVLFVGYAGQTVGLGLTTPSRSAFITGLCVLMVPGFVRILFKKPISRWTYVGAAIAVVGLSLVTSVSLAAAPLGDLLTLVCAVTFALHIAWTGHVAARYSPVALVGIQLLVVALLSAVAAPIRGIELHNTARLWVAAIGCGVVVSAAAVSIQVWAQARMSTVRMALIHSLEPVFAAAVSVLLGRELLQPSQWVGAGLMLAAIAVAEGGAWYSATRNAEVVANAG